MSVSWGLKTEIKKKNARSMKFWIKQLTNSIFEKEWPFFNLCHFGNNDFIILVLNMSFSFFTNKPFWIVKKNETLYPFIHNDK